MNKETDYLLRIFMIAGSAALGTALVSKYTAFTTATTGGLVVIASGGAVMAATAEANMDVGWDPTSVLAMKIPNIGNVLMRALVYSAGIYVTGANGVLEEAAAVWLTCAAGQLLF